MISLQVKNQIKTADVIGMGDQVLALLPKAVSIIGFLLLVVLVYRAAKAWKTLGVVELAAIVMAFALVGK